LLSSSRPIFSLRSSSQTCLLKMSSSPGGRPPRASATWPAVGSASMRCELSNKTMKSSSLSLVTSRRPHEPISTTVASRSTSREASRSRRSTSLRSVSFRAAAMWAKPTPVAAPRRATPCASFTFARPTAIRRPPPPSSPSARRASVLAAVPQGSRERRCTGRARRQIALRHPPSAARGAHR
jgi:hypothetical protein